MEMRQFQSTGAQAWHLVNWQESTPMESTCESLTTNPVSIVLIKADTAYLPTAIRGDWWSLWNVCPQVGSFDASYAQLLASHANDA